MRKKTLLVALAAALALALAAVAQAAKVTGGTTTIMPSPTALQVLSDNHITVAPLAPATASGSGITFPIARGHVNRKLHGRIFHRGGFTLSNGERTVRVRRPAVVSTKKGAFVFAAVRRPAHACPKPGGLTCHLKRHFRIVRVARLTQAHVEGTTATATVRITPATARLINSLAGRHAVNRGAVLGTATLSATLG